MDELQRKIEDHIKALSQFTATPDEGTTRLTYSKEDLQARAYIKEVMKSYGLVVREDGFGNIFGKLEGELEGPSVLIGSHFDSVPHGGDYDGPAGVIAGLEVAGLFFEKNIKPEYPLEVIALIEEEGSRFGGGLMGSRGMTGKLSEEDFARLKDKGGITTVEAMKAIGLNPALSKQRDPQSIKAFLELHIEQGPILEEKEIKIGIVESIVGLTQLEVTVEGKAGHAGTTPMDARSDALIAAAEAITQLPKLAIVEGSGTVITVGQLNVFPNGSNVIPNKVVFTIDIRSTVEDKMINVMEKAKEIILSANKTGVKTSIEQQLYMEPKYLNEEVRSILKEESTDLGIQHTSIHSGAGHDAMVFADVTAAGMIFIPSKDGLSHCPEEWSDAKDIATAVRILFETAKKLTGAKVSHG
ncbi:Zn-dependent hydrolase [Cytobacillus purgationiresistens]|uniref:Allantoate deiminase n=1 Tax=Cytobacillus purgationiresistens TaxID=863449 RepID=A0ABU0ANX0_9BACI|nr:Zn-dependent hydrolase [Cytobacillus purgationiresistens]MDQ0272467.1 allantoate deiminase [Cytobacillus purgationiresistens]